MNKSIFKWELNKNKEEVKKILLNSKEFKKEYETSWERVDYLMADINSIYIYSNEIGIQLSENAGVSTTSVICSIKINNKGISRSILEARFKIGIFSFNFFLWIFLVLLIISLLLLLFDFILSCIFFPIALFFLLLWYTKYLILKTILNKLKISIVNLNINESE